MQPFCTRHHRLWCDCPLRAAAHLQARATALRPPENVAGGPAGRCLTVRPSRPRKSLIEAGLALGQAAKQLGIGRTAAYRIAKSARGSRPSGFKVALVILDTNLAMTPTSQICVKMHSKDSIESPGINPTRCCDGR